jgi:hypothetical protein
MELMLARPPARARTSPAERRRARRREQQRRHRQRERDGRRAYLVEFDGQVIAMLVSLGWLAEAAAGDPREVARAVARLLADAAEKRNGY